MIGISNCGIRGRAAAVPGPMLVIVDCERCRSHDGDATHAFFVGEGEKVHAGTLQPPHDVLQRLHAQSERAKLCIMDADDLKLIDDALRRSEEIVEAIVEEITAEEEALREKQLAESAEREAEAEREAVLADEAEELAEAAADDDADAEPVDPDPF